MKKSVFQKLFMKNIVFFILEIISAYVVTQVLLLGNQKISAAIDMMLAGDGDTYIDAAFWWYMAVLIALGFGFSVLQSVAAKRFAVRILTGFRKESGRRLMHLEYCYYDTHTSAEVLNRFISDSQKVSEYYAEVLPWIVLSVVSVGTILVSIARVDMVLTVLLMVIVPVITFVSKYVNKRVSELTKMHWQLRDEVNEMAYDGLQGMNVIRSFCLESEMIRRIREANYRLLRYEYRRNSISAISWFLGDFVTWMPGIILGVIALLRVQSGHMTAGEMAYFLLLLDRIVAPLGQLPGYFIEARTDLVSRARLSETMNYRVEHGGETDYHTDENVMIDFQSVDFTYDGEMKILENCSFTILKGSNVAFVGESGSGKSTILKLICGLYAPEGGRIRIMGKDVSQSDVSVLREHLAVVSQDSFLFPESIEWNVRCGNEQVSREQVMEACKKAQIHDYIMTLPKGYDTNVGERGDLLSGGQKQRISIARALIKNAEIILFDEPTASVDVQNENEIKKALKEAAEGKTVITVAHRLNTIQNADCIYVLHHGSVAEQGSHEELLAVKGIYSRLYETGSKESEEGMCNA